MMLKITFIWILSVLILTNAEVKHSPLDKLNNGQQIPIVGLGTWQMVFDRPKAEALNQTVDDTPVIKAVTTAIEVGYRHIDTAYCYNNEKAIGIALNQAMTAHKLGSEHMFITTKIWNTFHSRSLALENVKMSLKDLGLNYTDLALMHFPMGFKEGNITYPTFENGSAIPNSWEKDNYLETWKGLEDAVKLGLAKSIGVSNFNARQLQKLIENAQIKPVVNQVECNPYYNQQKLLDFCKSKNITLMAYSPIRQSDKDMANEPVMKEVAQKHNKTITQVALRWNIQRGVLIIPKSTHRKYLEENLDVFDFNISDEDINRISGLKQKAKINVLENAKNLPDYPFNDEY